MFFESYRPDPGCWVNRIAPIYEALPRFDHPDFVIMTQWLHSKGKGYVSVQSLHMERANDLAQIMGPEWEPDSTQEGFPFPGFLSARWVVGGPRGLKYWGGNNQAKDSIEYKIRTMVSRFCSFPLSIKAVLLRRHVSQVNAYP